MAALEGRIPENALLSHDLFEGLHAPAAVAFLALGWLVLPGHPLAWTVGVLAAIAFPLYPLAVRFGAGPGAQQPSGVFLRILGEDVKTASAQTLLQITFLAYHAYGMAHAIALTLVRLVITQRRLLQWETAAAATARAAGLSARAGALLFLAEMAASPLIALIVLVMIAAARPSSLAVAGPLLALWVAAPLVAYWLSQPVSPERQLLSSEDRRFLRLIARKTWRYFETFMGAEDHGLPPDNFQEAPTPRVAHRTSPTNIGMGLLSTLAAHDLGFIRTPELVERLEATVSTMGGLERFEGHL